MMIRRIKGNSRNSQRTHHRKICNCVHQMEHGSTGHQNDCLEDENFSFKFGKSRLKILATAPSVQAYIQSIYSLGKVAFEILPAKRHIT